MYRVYDKFLKKWVGENIFLSPQGNLYVVTKNLFGFKKLSLVSEDRYIYHKDIGLCDKNDNLIFEGDICRGLTGFTGIVTYIEERASYVLLDKINNHYYNLFADYCKRIEVIGNIFDTQDMRL